MKLQIETDTNRVREDVANDAMTSMPEIASFLRLSVELLSEQGTDGRNPFPKVCERVIPTVGSLHISACWGLKTKRLGFGVVVAAIGPKSLSHQSSRRETHRPNPLNRVRRVPVTGDNVLSSLMVRFVNRV